ncbi:uncharacterized protein LOC133534192 isoform X2 [Cydia pomonella]|uniref:uncharacterized protein LOC133534192 isoform X2 n=1 Tax=Cydia pomonella TaxID=82600 RepID=UPI002ADE1857|nr:uncharacterized protein LOC133534192 isoform X2 [Cydia pomonella]
MCGAQVRLAAGQAGEEEGRAARTHCTWPLAPQASLAITEEPACCVRSDLFLAAHDDDSQQMIPGAASAEPVLEAASPLPPLGLLDYMQEELLYTDAVDESSFQVLLLSEELG